MNWSGINALFEDRLTMHAVNIIMEFKKKPLLTCLRLSISMLSFQSLIMFFAVGYQIAYNV